MGLYPQGKGMYIWILDRIHNGNLGQMLAQAQTLQLDWVSLKVADADGAFLPNEVGPAVQAFKAAGLRVWGWQFIYGDTHAGIDNSAAEGAFGAQIINTLDLDGLMIDAEGRYERLPSARSQAQNYMGNLRSGLAGRPAALGLNSFRYPSLHGTFPFAEFLAGCSFHIPQVYWELDDRATGPVFQLNRSMAELQAIRQLPFIPLGISCADNGWKPSPQQLINFNQACLDAGLPGMGWYEWGGSLLEPELIAAVGQANGWRAPGGNTIKHTLAGLTNQQVINLFCDAFGVHQYFDILTSAGLAGLAQDAVTRLKPYAGPAIEDMQFPDPNAAQMKAILISVLG